ncbi:MAG: biotin--[acetyl-CoA-carboxylase] ligase [Pseudomonadota bacterium]
MGWPTHIGRFAIEAHDSLVTTQDPANALSEAGRVDVVVVAERQTGGRGRRGRAWTSPVGNLYASTVIAPPREKALVPCASLVVAVAMAEAVERLGVASDRLRLKWPNDVLLDDGKVAGILIDYVAERLVVGTGLNVQERPDDPPNARTLRDAGVDVTAEAALRSFLLCLAARLEVLDDVGFGPAREAWLGRAAGLGAPLRARVGGRMIEGTQHGIDEAGALQIETAEGLRTINAGDVELVRLAATGTTS